MKFRNIKVDTNDGMAQGRIKIPRNKPFPTKSRFIINASKIPKEICKKEQTVVQNIVLNNTLRKSICTSSVNTNLYSSIGKLIFVASQRIILKRPP